MLEKSAKTLHDIVNDEKGKNVFLKLHDQSSMVYNRENVHLGVQQVKC